MCILLKNSSFPKLVHRGDPFWSPSHPPSPFETFFCGRTYSKQILFSLTSDGAAILSGRPAGMLGPERLSMTKKQKPDTNSIEPGMVVEATKGDLGEEDVSQPKVSSVVRDQHGDVEKLVVHKGVVFKKTLEIPADRIQSVEAANQDESSTGKVTIEVSKEEAASLTAVGAEEFSPEKQRGLLDKVEQKIPTAEGVRRLEARGTATPAK